MIQDLSYDYLNENCEKVFDVRNFPNAYLDREVCDDAWRVVENPKKMLYAKYWSDKK